MNSLHVGRRVLVVEDEMIVAWNLEDMLDDLGCVVVGPATSISQALAMIDAAAIDAALLDVNLDGQPSYPVADALAARGVPFAFATGYDKDSLAERYRAVPILRKPFHASALDDILKRLLPSGSPSIEAVKTEP